MSILRAFRDGVGRVSSAPVLLGGLLLLTFLFALPLGLTLRGMLQAHMGGSLVAVGVADGADYAWWEEFARTAEGVGRSFTPGIIGFAAVIDSLSAVADGRGQTGAVAGVTAAYLVLWTFLLGGILDRFARNRPTRAHGFFAASGVFFFRFLRLAIVAGLVYYVLFAWIHGLLFDALYGRVTRDFTAERAAFAVRLVLYAVFGALLVLCTIVFDYAKVRAVVEDRRSMMGALLASLRFVIRHWVSVVGLYTLTGLVFVAVLAAWAFAAPGAGRTGWPMWLAFLLAQVLILARLWVKLVFSASEVALFQGALAHAEYTAAPVPVWPESPAAEAIAPPQPAPPERGRE